LISYQSMMILYILYCILMSYF